MVRVLYIKAIIAWLYCMISGSLPTMYAQPWSFEKYKQLIEWQKDIELQLNEGLPSYGKLFWSDSMLIGTTSLLRPMYILEDSIRFYTNPGTGYVRTINPFMPSYLKRESNFISCTIDSLYNFYIAAGRMINFRSTSVYKVASGFRIHLLDPSVLDYLNAEFELLRPARKPVYGNLADAVHCKTSIFTDVCIINSTVITMVEYDAGQKYITLFEVNKAMIKNKNSASPKNYHGGINKIKEIKLKNDCPPEQFFIYKDTYNRLCQLYGSGRLLVYDQDFNSIEYQTLYRAGAHCLIIDTKTNQPYYTDMANLYKQGVRVGNIPLIPLTF